MFSETRIFPNLTKFFYIFTAKNNKSLMHRNKIKLLEGLALEN